MAAEEVGDETSGCKIDRMLCAEQFDAHHGTGKRRVRGTGEHCDESQSGEQIHRCMKQPRQRVSQSRPDEEQRRDLAAFETAAERDAGKKNFPQPAPGTRAIGLEG